MSYDPEPEIKHYLERLSSAAHDLPKARRRELLSEIEEHIRQALAQTPCANRDEMRTLLEQVGDPDEIATAAEDQPDVGARGRSPAIAYVRRHPGRAILIVAALAAIVLGIVSAVWVQSYQPLSYLGQSKVRGPVPVAFHPGFRFSVGATVQNTGRFTVRVLGVPYKSGPFSGHPVSARLMMSRDTGGARFQPMPGLPSKVHFMLWPGGPYEPFHPFNLKPGQVRSLLFTGVYGNCTPAARNLVPISVPDFPVRFSFLWKTATTRLPLPNTLEIIPPSGGCPSAIALSHHLNASSPSGRTRVFKAETIKPGVRIFCAGNEARASTPVPKRGQSNVGTADGPGGSGHATIRLTTRTDGTVVAHCTSGDLPAATSSP